jgi:hypothetical protein
MKHPELLVLALAAGLAAFVAVEASSVHVIASAGDGASAIVSDAGASKSTAASGTAAISAAEDARGVAAYDAVEVRRRLTEGATGTYVGDILALRDSAIARWPERRSDPLRVWVQPWSDLPHFQESFVPLVRDAFKDWSDTGIPLAFAFVADSASAEVHVTWIDRFDEPISGKTLWAHDDKWWIVEANIVLALHHRTGEPLDADAVRAIALHEVGHLVGLDHTTDTSTIMTPKVRVKELQPSDRATARLIYALPPGRLK